jgi:hypothetical protein
MRHVTNASRMRSLSFGLSIIFPPNILWKLHGHDLSTPIVSSESINFVFLTHPLAGRAKGKRIAHLDAIPFA